MREVFKTSFFVLPIYYKVFYCAIIITFLNILSGKVLFFLIIHMEVEELLKVVLQDGGRDCGVCCLLSIIRYYKGEVSKEYLRELTGTTRNGVSLYQLVSAATSLGFSCEGVKGELSYLDYSRLPCIAHIVFQKKYQHFVVIYQIDISKEKIVIMDPAKGRVVLSFSEFKLLSSGYFIYLTPVKQLPVFREVKSLFVFIKKFCHQYRFYLFFLFLFSFLVIFCQIITTFHFQYLYDYAILSSFYDNILNISVFMLLFYLCLILCQALKDSILIKISSIFDEELIFYVYQQILLLPYLFFKNRTLGEVLERIKDVIQVKNFVLRLFSSFITDFLFLVIFLILLFRIHVFLALLLVVYFFLSFVISFSLYKIKKKKQKKVLKKSDYIQSFLVENFQSVDTIKGLHLESDFFNQFRQEYRNYLSTSYKLSFLLEVEQHVKNVFYYGMLLLFYGFSAYYVIQGKLSIAEFFIYQFIFQYLIGCFERIFLLFSDSYSIPIAIHRIHDLFHLFRENFEGGGYYQLTTLQKDISIMHLTFSYTTRVLFSDFSLFISYGDKILITGESGGGKSTLVKMLMRYIEVPFGMIRIGEIDINHYHLDLLRSRISYVTGSELLFSNTIYYNITLNRSVEYSQVFEVSKLVLLDEVISRYSSGYDTMVEENGFNFSSGERQRILLARALLKNSDIYIFDEAFHNIDVDKERIILSNIFSYLKDKTVIVISHRLQHLDLYQHRYRIEKGEVHEI